MADGAVIMDDAGGRGNDADRIADAAGPIGIRRDENGLQNMDELKEKTKLKHKIDLVSLKDVTVSYGKTVVTVKSPKDVTVTGQTATAQVAFRLRNRLIKFVEVGASEPLTDQRKRFVYETSQPARITNVEIDHSEITIDGPDPVKITFNYQ